MKLYIKKRKKAIKPPLGKPSRKAVKARVPQTPTPTERRILNEQNHDPKTQLALSAVVNRVVVLAQMLSEKKFYDYQIELCARIVESLLLHDGEVLTILMARQMGKTECIGSISAAIAVIFPTLAKQYPNDWRLNLTDDQGVYRGYAFGIRIGIYAPRLDQSGLMFDRVKKALGTDTAKKIFSELSLKMETSNGNTVLLSNGARVFCESASEQSKIEGETHHLLVAEECQDITDLKIRKSLHPMVSATNGTIVKVGTATTQKCDFYDAIRVNERMHLVGGKQNHFFYPYTVGIKYNSLYAAYLKKEIVRLGEDSDEFRTSYCGEWIFERGMFVTHNQLFNIHVANTEGVFSERHDFGLPTQFRHYDMVAGIDWGSSSDSTVLTLMAVDWKNPLDSGAWADAKGNHDYVFYQKHVLGWFEWIGDNYETQFWDIESQLNLLPGLRKIVTDSNTCGKPIFDRLTATFQPRGIEVEGHNFQPRNKSDGFKALYWDICAKRITFPASPTARRDIRFRKFVNQMLELRKSYRNGNMVVAHPDEKGAHDDYPDSFMLAAWGASQPSGAIEFDIYDENPFLG